MHRLAVAMALLISHGVALAQECGTDSDTARALIGSWQMVECTVILLGDSCLDPNAGLILQSDGDYFVTDVEGVVRKDTWCVERYILDDEICPSRVCDVLSVGFPPRPQFEVFVSGDRLQLYPASGFVDGAAITYQWVGEPVSSDGSTWSSVKARF